MASHPAHAQPLGDEDTHSDTSSLPSTAELNDADQFDIDEEYAMLAGTFNAYGGLSPGLHADYVAPWASAFKENVRRLITEESPNMIPLKRKMFLDSVNFLFKDVFGMRARRRLMYLRNSQVTPDLNSPAPNIGQNVPAAIQLFANHYSAWCRAGKLNGVHYQVLQFKASHQMYEDFQVLCRDHNGAIKAFLSSRGLTPTSGRKHHDLVIEYLVEELGVEVSPYQFQQTVRDMECVSSLVRSFGHGVLALLPQETISCLQVWNPNPERIILLLEASFITEARPMQIGRREHSATASVG